MLRRLTALFSLTIAGPLFAQTSRIASLRVGALAGFNSTTLGGSDVAAAKHRSAFAGGVYVVRPLDHGLAIRLEGLYSEKGAESLSEQGVSFATATLDLAYVELPVLLQLESTAGRGIRPHAYAGPSFGVLTSCRLEVEVSSQSRSSSCADADLDTKSFELAGVIGGGVGFRVSALAATVGVRYQHGFSDIVSDAKARNRVFGLYGSLGLDRR